MWRSADEAIGGVTGGQCPQWGGAPLVPTSQQRENLDLSLYEITHNAKEGNG